MSQVLVVFTNYIIEDKCDLRSHRDTHI